MGNSEIDGWLKGQLLRQKGSMGCGVPVFARFANVPEDEILSAIPGELGGITDKQAEKYLRSKGLPVRRYNPDQTHPLPCVHLVETSSGSGRHHWIYENEDGIYDPDPVCESCPPQFIKQNFNTFYGPVALTFALESNAENTT